MYSILILFIGLSAGAQNNDSALSVFKPGKLAAQIQNKQWLELASANKSWIIKGQLYPHDLDADAAVARRQIVCSVYIPSQQLQSDNYVLYLIEHYQFNAHHLEMMKDNKFIGVTCFKNEKLDEMTLADLNQAFNGLIQWAPIN